MELDEGFGAGQKLSLDRHIMRIHQDEESSLSWRKKRVANLLAMLGTTGTYLRAEDVEAILGDLWCPVLHAAGGPLLVASANQPRAQIKSAHLRAIKQFFSFPSRTLADLSNIGKQQLHSSSTASSSLPSTRLLRLAPLQGQFAVSRNEYC